MSALNKRDSHDLTAGLIGQMAGEYRILRKLGAGGFGAVYAAEHPLLKRRAAVKVLHANPGVDSVTVQRFIEEARSASQIRHRHIVDIFSFGTLPNGQYFYVMDLLEGTPLDRYLKRHGRLEPELALPLLRPIAHAVDALHAASIVHRDLKPANIYLAWEPSGEVVPKLLDFGLVKLLSQPSLYTASGVPMGTPYYMSPEQCRGEVVDARADVYSFGVICHELFTGKVPFSGDSATAVLVAHVLQPPPRMSDVCPELSSDLDEAVLRMLAKEPDARPSTAGDALSELERAARLAGVTLVNGLPWLPRLPDEPEAPGADARAFAEHGKDDAAHGGHGIPGTFGSGERPADAALAGGAKAQPGRRRAFMAALIALLLSVSGVAIYRFSSPQQPSGLDASPVIPAAARPRSTTAAQQPAAVAPGPAAVAAAPVATPSQITLDLRGAAPGAVVMLGDRTLGPANGPVMVPYGVEPVQLTVVAPGYEPRAVTITPNASLELALAPDKNKRRSSKRTQLPRDLENPF